MNNTFLIPAAILITIIAASCGSNEENKKPVVVAATVKYKTMELQPKQISGNVQLPGVMQPFQFVQIFPKISGFVKNVAVDRGSAVHQGQVLITLDAPEVAQQVAAAMQKYTQAQAAYITSKDRHRRLLETSKTPGTISPFDLEAAASKMQGDSATAQGEYASYKAAETMRNYLTITAPFDGVITERNIHPGALAGPGTQNSKPMLVLQQLSKLRLEVVIPEQYATQVQDGDKIHFKPNALPGQEFLGEISRSSQSLGDKFRSETIEIDVPNPDNKFKPGMYAEVTLPTSGNAHAFVVPVSAIIATTERKYIVALKNNVAQLLDISEGNKGNDSTEIFVNLQSGEKIITNPNYRIKDGDTLAQ